MKAKTLAIILLTLYTSCAARKPIKPSVPPPAAQFILMDNGWMVNEGATPIIFTYTAHGKMQWSLVIPAHGGFYSGTIIPIIRDENR